MTLLRDQVLQVLERAESTEVGIQIRIITPTNQDSVTPALRAKQILYRFQKELAPRFSNLMIKFHPEDPDHRILVLKTAKG